jgi:hypothetical protein
MRNTTKLVLSVALVFTGCSGSESTGGDPMIDASGSGSNSDGGSNSDSGIDAPSVSHAPCPTCCDPIAQTGCGAGEACYQYEGTEGGMDTYCATAGTKLHLAACVNDSECAPGFDCFDYFHNCRKFCTSNADCPSATPQCLLGTKPPDAPYGICN